MSRTILVTGCSSGIGRHCAIRLREQGWRVFATARTPKDLEELATLGFDPVELDYALPRTIRGTFDTVAAACGGRLDAVFRNGAYGQPGAVEDVSTDCLRAQFEANFFGWHELTRMIVPLMRRNGAGRIVACSSILGLIPYRWRGAYIASKFAVEGLFLTLRLELLGSGIHVSLIEPGPIQSKFTLNALTHFRRNIDIDGSVHAETYRRHLARLSAGGGINRFRRTPEAVFAKLEHALNSSSPKAQYTVTIPTHFMSRIRSVAPQRILDRLLLDND
jgi:NAD(P)-dependent dehydrogenase (short-subunit alcohol dehydrogenase family)